MISHTPTSTALQHSSPLARQTGTTTVSVTTIASGLHSSIASDAKIRAGIITSTTPQAPIIVDSAAGEQRKSPLLLWIVLVSSLVCCFVMPFVRKCKKAKSAAGVDEPDLEASQASSSPLMFKSPDARDLSVMAGSTRSEFSRTSEQCIEPQPSNASGPVPLVWETPEGERTVYVTNGRLGVKFHAKFPLEVKCQPEGHGKELGIHAGWVLKSVNGVVVTPGTDMNSVLRLHAMTAGSMRSEIPKTPEPHPSHAAGTVPLVWETPEGERTVYAAQRKLGVKFHAKFPLEVKCQPEGHGKELGIHAGWVLKSVNGVVVTPGTDLDSVLHLH